MDKKEKKTGFFGKLLGGNKASSCCTVEFEEVPEIESNSKEETNKPPTGRPAGGVRPVRSKKVSDLDKTLKEMDLGFFASGQHGVTLAMAADCLKSSERCIFLDVRTKEEARYLRFGNVLHIPLEQLPDRFGEIPRNQPVVVFCTSVVRASMAAFYLKAEGITSARTLMANSEEMVRLFSPAGLLLTQDTDTQRNRSCCISGGDVWKN